VQRFSTWGTRTPGGTQAVHRGYATSSEGISKVIKKHPKEDYMGIMFDQGVRKRGPILIWGYAERYNFDLGVRKYQKVENPCFSGKNNNFRKEQFFNQIFSYRFKLAKIVACHLYATYNRTLHMTKKRF
jgi:hypothetical protein